jgi:hypothetical protein
MDKIGPIDIKSTNLMKVNRTQRIQMNQMARLI